MYTVLAIILGVVLVVAVFLWWRNRRAEKKEVAVESSYSAAPASKPQPQGVTSQSEQAVEPPADRQA